ncbi:MAG: TonB-dependent receptor [Fimbriimonadaceae bacterium]|nr:TonB-dependent receptor [Chitinophagales bacterium]
MKKIYIVPVFILIVLQSISAQTITGMVVNDADAGKMEPLIGASVMWFGESEGTITDIEGFFEIEKTNKNQNVLRISYVGFTTDTIQVEDEKFLHIMLSPAKELKVITVEGESSASSLNTINPIGTETLGHKEMKKAACCNLSESFETNAAVDAEYSDAITGARTIKLLGLDGVYAQIMTENMASVRGLSAAYGLTYIPGPWIESIQITKGVGSVVNGYESITGAINTELRKPYELEEEKFLLNLFGSNSGRYEANINYHHLLNEHFSTSVLLHTSQLQNKMDHNDDGFLDVPLTENYIFMNRWNYASGKVYEAQAGIKYISSDLIGGQLTFDADADRNLDNGYGVGVHTQRIEAYIKNGFVFGRPNTSIGTILSGAWHEADNYYGLNNYVGKETYLHSNIIGQTFIGNTNHLVKSGVSYLFDDYDETYDSINYVRTENVPGIFTEYYFKQNEKLNMLAGARVDFHNLYGTFFTPRIHFKYAFTPQTTMRLSGGKGYRVPNLFAENSSILTSSRQLIITEDILPEQAWNYGISFIQLFTLNNYEGTISIDGYRTDFENQLIVDLDSDAEKIYVSNLSGKSFSNAAQIEINYMLFKNFDFRIAYKYVDAQTTYNDTLRQVPLTYKHRGLVNAAYKTLKGGWVFDATAQYYGTSRLPELTENHEAHHLPEYSPQYVLLLAQITKKWDKLEVYIGSENLTNYTQHDPIIAANDPFGQYFDASVIYGPVMERKFYAGLRFTLKDNN